jgi:hypothetical protein
MYFHPYLITEKFMTNLITGEELRRIVHYDPIAGEFTWLRREPRSGIERIDNGWNTRFEGKPIAMRLDRKGYRIIGIVPHGNMAAHRLAWLYVTGAWPTCEIDHINGIPLDNRIANLREATRLQNVSNQKIRVNNTTGIKGVSWSKKSKRWYAYISQERKMYALGLFDNLDEAVKTRKDAEIRFFGEFNRSMS